MERSTSDNPFVEYQPSILMAAVELYHAEVEGVEPDPDISRVMVLPRSLGRMSVDGFVVDTASERAAFVAEAEVNVAARSVARLAVLADIAEKGGFIGLIARGEAAMTRVMERKYIRDALASGLVDSVRGR